jgi:hypothetical protein
MNPVWITLTLFIVAVGFVGLVLSYNIGKKKKDVVDEGNTAAAKHPILKNPMIIAFLVFGLGMPLIIYLISLLF